MPVKVIHSAKACMIAHVTSQPLKLAKCQNAVLGSEFPYKVAAIRNRHPYVSEKVDHFGLLTPPSHNIRLNIWQIGIKGKNPFFDSYLEFLKNILI
jgi:hypothetical protein